VKLQHLNDDNQKRREIAQFYCLNSKNQEIILPYNGDSSVITKDHSHVWHLFVIRHPKRDALQQYLADNGIQTLIHYPIPPHRQNAFKEWNNLSYPVTEKIHREVLSLPMSPVLSFEDIEYITKKVNSFSL
jgi:dTDP-4-amino-4,6-dideoxygalactose transaminase